MEYNYIDEKGNTVAMSAKDMAIEMDRAVRDALVCLKFELTACEEARVCVSDYFNKILDKSKVTFQDVSKALETTFPDIAYIAESIHIGQNVMINDHLYMELGYNTPKDYINSIDAGNKPLDKYFVPN